MSMIHARDLMPSYITENSRDIHAFLRLIDLAFNSQKLKSEDYISILNPDKCPNDLLPLLASYLGYEYDYNETYDRNRVIIRSYKNMKRNKGNLIGIKLAVSASISMLVNKSVTESQSLFDVAYYDKYYTCSNCGYVAYEDFEECPKCGESGTSVKSDVGSIVVVIEYPKYSTKSYDLIEAVRPAGSGLRIFNGTIEEINETLGLSDFVKAQLQYLNLGNSEVGGKDSLVGFMPILKESHNFNTNTDVYKYCGNCHKLSLVGNGVNNCPLCNSDDFKIENNSSLRYLYRLYNTQNTFYSIIESINDGNTISSTDEIGVILRIHINTNESKWYDLNNFTESFIFGLKPTVHINSSNYFEYEYSEILDKLTAMNETNLSVLENKAHETWSYNFKKDTNNNYIIMVSKPPEENDGTVVIQTHTYNLSSIKWGVISNNTVDYTDVELSDVCDSRQMGKDNITSDSEYDIGGNLNQNDTMKDFDGKYINVCRACNEVTVYGSDILVCPHCGGTHTEIIDNVTIINKDPTILTGSYLLDLYFE